VRNVIEIEVHPDVGEISLEPGLEVVVHEK
jgi:hypothetical protein